MGRRKKLVELIQSVVGMRETLIEGGARKKPICSLQSVQMVSPYAYWMRCGSDKSFDIFPVEEKRMLTTRFLTSDFAGETCNENNKTLGSSTLRVYPLLYIYIGSGQKSQTFGAKGIKPGPTISFTLKPYKLSNIMLFFYLCRVQSDKRSALNANIPPTRGKHEEESESICAFCTGLNNFYFFPFSLFRLPSCCSSLYFYFRTGRRAPQAENWSDRQQELTQDRWAFY